MAPCKHPRVQIVAREEDSEFVECKECGEIFESSEFKDMIIEDTKLRRNPDLPLADLSCDWQKPCAAQRPRRDKGNPAHWPLRLLRP